MAKSSKKGFAYNANIDLYHHEAPAKINKITGQITDLSVNIKNNLDMVTINEGEPYQKYYTKAWKLLESQTTKAEFILANKLAWRAKAFSNSLIPLNETMTIKLIAEELNEDYRTIMKKIDKLFKLGVIAKFEVYKANEEYTKYWVFNPYLSFNGKVIKRGIAELFEGTYYHLLSE